jgi:hypothetical protein
MDRRLHKLARRMVRATHSWPGPKQLYRSIYDRAAAAAGRLADDIGSIAGIYARNSYANGTWIAGISDIDLTVVWSNAHREDLESFYARYDSMRKTFPMLGEAEMLEERHLAAWSSCGLAGLEARNWRRLGGAHRFDPTYRGDERLDRLRHATGIYRHNLAETDGEIFQRWAAKLFRTLGKAAHPATDRAGVLAACLRELSADITAACVDYGSGLDYDQLLGCRNYIVRRGPEPRNSAGLILLGRHDEDAPRFAVTPNPNFKPTFANAVVMDPVVFRFYLCHVDPLEHFALLQGRTLFSGPDILADPFPMSESALRDCVRHYAVQMFTFPYRRELAGQADLRFRDLLHGWFLRTLRFFEEGRMIFDFDLLREYFGTRHLESRAPNRSELLLSVLDELSPHLLAEDSISSVRSQER